jgi:hypothetical protein
MTNPQSLENHLRQRGLMLEKYSDVFVSETDGVVTFLLWNLSGQLVGYQVYNPNGSKKERTNLKNMKYRTQVGSSFHQPVWGLNTIRPETKTVFLVEGVFDAAKLHAAGFAALAIFSSAGSKQLINFLNLLPYQLVSILDNDDSKKSFSAFSDVVLVTPSPYKDVGEMPIEELKAFLNEQSLT